MEIHLQVNSYSSKKLTSRLATVISEAELVSATDKAAEELPGAQPLWVSVSFLFQVEKETKECPLEPVHRGKRANPVKGKVYRRHPFPPLLTVFPLSFIPQEPKYPPTVQILKFGA